MCGIEKTVVFCDVIACIWYNFIDSQTKVQSPSSGYESKLGVKRGTQAGALSEPIGLTRRANKLWTLKSCIQRHITEDGTLHNLKRSNNLICALYKHH
jgi:hypothetical protein